VQGIGERLILNLKSVRRPHSRDLVEMMIEGQYDCINPLCAAANHNVRERKHDAPAVQFPERLFDILLQAIVGRNVDHHVPAGRFIYGYCFPNLREKGTLPQRDCKR
jgi:hypothetical protein